MSADKDPVVYLGIAHGMAMERAGNRVREAAMYLARMGFSAKGIREAMRDLVEKEAERAVKWAAEYDADEAADLADEMNRRTRSG